MWRRASRAGLLALVVSLPVGAMPPDQAQSWRDDLRFMASAMERTHKNLFHTTSRTEFAAKVNALDARIPTLERHEVIVELAKIVASVGDGHTNIYPSRDARIGFHALPVAFTFFGDDLYVRAAHTSQQSLVGGRVLRIGDRNAADAYSVVKTMIGRDNAHGARYWGPVLLAMPEVLHALRITHALNDVPLMLETTHGTETVVLHPFEPVQIMSGDIATVFSRRTDWVDARSLSGQPEPAWLRGAGDAFHMEHIGDLLYVQINQVYDKPNETLAQFAGRLRREIAETRPEKVAIDLRLNRGGDATLLPPLIRALVQSPGIDCGGRLFGIIGPATFSAAQMFTDALEKYTRMTFVGEPTGSKGNAYGDSRKITLPHSGITVRASVYYWQEWHPLDTRDTLSPQIPAVLGFDAYRRNADVALEAIAAVKPGPCGP